MQVEHTTSACYLRCHMARLPIGELVGRPVEDMRKTVIENLSEIIKMYRQKAGLSKSALARATGVDRELVTRWEEGKTINMSLPILVSLMNECGVDVELVFTEREASE